MISERRKMAQIQLDLSGFGWRSRNCDRNSVISADRSTFGRNKLFRQNNRKALKSQKHLLPNIRPNNCRNYSADTLYGRSLALLQLNCAIWLLRRGTQTFTQSIPCGSPFRPSTGLPSWSADWCVQSTSKRIVLVGCVISRYGCLWPWGGAHAT